ncbi:amidase [Algihabitans albus]|uniref:amidase n=1 Tax=Algihabitans albus TaxID=2164067 RepID=UPI000E5D66EA|nr:amidase [Algihabitans albus]
MTSDPALLSAQDLLRAYAAKTLSPVEATQAALDRVDRLNERLNAFCLVDHEGALEAARASEKRWHAGAPRGRLDGIPTTVKDVIQARNWPTKRGSLVLGEAGPDAEDSPATARLRSHNAVFLGKTTTPEFGWKGVTDNQLTGITRNPWNPDMTPGGSSGGAAAAAATGMGALHIGTDGGGSIRIPCGFTGIPGFKPSFGRVPAWPLSPFGTVSHVGPMARTVGDCALMLTVMAEPDLRDPYSLPYDGPDYTQGLEAGVAGLRIAFSPTFGPHQVHPEIAAALETAARTFAELGATVEQPDLDIPDTAEIFRTVWFSGAANLFRRFTSDQNLRIDPGLQEVAAEGATYSANDLFDAVAGRESVSVWMNRLHADYDLLLLPCLPIPAFQAGQEVPSGSGMKRWTEWTPYSYPFNLTGQPAISVPCGLTATGLPMALQLVGPRYADALVLRAAKAFETAVPATLPPAAMETVPA